MPFPRPLCHIPFPSYKPEQEIFWSPTSRMVMSHPEPPLSPDARFESHKQQDNRERRASLSGRQCVGEGTGGKEMPAHKDHLVLTPQGDTALVAGNWGNVRAWLNIPLFVLLRRLEGLYWNLGKGGRREGRRGRGGGRGGTRRNA